MRIELLSENSDFTQLVTVGEDEPADKIRTSVREDRVEGKDELQVMDRTGLQRRM